MHPRTRAATQHSLLGLHPLRGVLFLCLEVSSAFLTSPKLGTSSYADTLKIQLSPNKLFATKAGNLQKARTQVRMELGLLQSLECVKNVRDLASVTGSPIKPGRKDRPNIS